MLKLVKMALRITTDAFDLELLQHIEDCTEELRMLGIYHDGQERDKQITAAIIYFCKARFGTADAESDRWERIYRDKVAMLQIAKNYGGRGREEA